LTLNKHIFTLSQWHQGCDWKFAQSWSALWLTARCIARLCNFFFFALLL